MIPLHIDPARRRYRALIGTGGIGSGVVFALNGNHTLGREESRSGRFLENRDYCKLHIIAHYVRALLDSGFAVIPVGGVGGDAAGRALLDEMRAAGLDVRYVQTDPGRRTMYCTCLVYPDGSGGNLTVDDSASAAVTPGMIAAAEPEFAACAGAGIALAAPEVPVDARVEILRLGTKYGFLRAASFTSGEWGLLRGTDALRQTDLLAVNLDEAAAFAGVSAEQPTERLVEAAVAAFRREQPGILVSITAGRRGSWVWDGHCLTHRPILAVETRGAAGAGDAHFAGMLVGLSAGLTPVEAQELATLVAAMSVTSPHTINRDIDGKTLGRFARESNAPVSAAVGRLLGNTHRP